MKMEVIIIHLYYLKTIAIAIVFLIWQLYYCCISELAITTIARWRLRSLYLHPDSGTSLFWRDGRDNL